MRINAILAYLCLLTVASLSHAKEWHGIVPLHSTRAEVERLLGPSTDPTKGHASIHKTKNEVVLVVWRSWVRVKQHENKSSANDKLWRKRGSYCCLTAKLK
jgi:hypothetical protein